LREVAFKVVAIMQTLTEELDDAGKKILRKLFGIPEDYQSTEIPIGEKRNDGK
jgi:hypothetical protein